MEIQTSQDGSTTLSQSVPMAPLAPISSNERIEVLDVVRGFALIGIFFMNIEWFNRTMSEFASGIPQGISQIDWIAHYFVNYFVAGKFWTIFSLLFGVGFAVMLTRSEESGRAFLKPYIRRILALAVFGAIHQIFLWPGDILLSYAFTAAGLLIILFGNWKGILLCFLILIGVTLIPGMNSLGIIASGVAFMGLLAFYFQSEKIVAIAGRKIPLVSLLLGLVGLGCFVFAAVAFFVPSLKEVRFPVLVNSFAFLITCYYSAKCREPVSLRLLRGGAWLYLSMFVIGSAIGIVNFQKPARNVMANVEAVKLADKKQTEKAEKEKLQKEKQLAQKSGSASSGNVSAKDASEKEDRAIEKKRREKLSEAEKNLENDADLIVFIRERRVSGEKEVKILTGESYVEFLQYRAKEFARKGLNSAGLAFLAISMFMIGVWSVRAGIVSRLQEHLPLFRRLVIVGLPLGWSLSILASFVAIRDVPEIDGNGWGLSTSLLHLANFPACLAYIGLVVLAFYSASIFSKVKVLGPYGRMALTNYLSQSLIQACFFYGWGFGNFGMGRAAQLGFAVVVIAAQIVISHWWLSKFRYGPLEWIWRAVTYWNIPAFRH